MLNANRPIAENAVPWIRTELPGPNARQCIARDERVTSPSYTRVYPLVVARGEGAVIEDVDGNRFLDFNAGIAVCSTGHCHPRVVDAIQKQAANLLHMSGTDFYYPTQFELAEKLTQITAGKVTQRRGFGPLVPGVIHVPYPDSRGGKHSAINPIEMIEKFVFRKEVAPDEVAAIFV